MTIRRLAILGIALFTHTLGCGDDEDRPDGGSTPNDTGVAPVIEFANADRSIVVVAKEMAQVPAGGITITDKSVNDAPQAFKDTVNGWVVMKGLLKAWELGPDGATFDPPLEVTVVVDAQTSTRTPTYFGMTLNGTAIESLDIVQITEPDPTHVAITFSVTHFSDFAAGHGDADVDVRFTGTAGPFDYTDVIAQTFEITNRSLFATGISISGGENNCFGNRLGIDAYRDVNLNDVFTLGTSHECKVGMCTAPVPYTGRVRGTHPLLVPPVPFSFGFRGALGSASCELKWTVGTYAVGMAATTINPKVQVSVISIGNKSYPAHQFRRGEIDMCAEPHWHSFYGDFKAYALELFLLGSTPSNIEEPTAERMICGYGTVADLPSTVATVNYETWKQFASMIRCESDRQCGMFTE